MSCSPSAPPPLPRSRTREEREFRAHKILLAARSDYFRMLFLENQGRGTFGSLIKTSVDQLVREGQGEGEGEGEDAHAHSLVVPLRSPLSPPLALPPLSCPPQLSGGMTRVRMEHDHEAIAEVISFIYSDTCKLTSSNVWNLMEVRSWGRREAMMGSDGVFDRALLMGVFDGACGCV